MKRHLYLLICSLYLIAILTSCSLMRQTSPGIQHTDIPSWMNLWHVKWSPGGTRIVFLAVKNRDPTYPEAIYVYNLITKKTVTIPIEAENLSTIKQFTLNDINWSPDGTKLAVIGGPVDKPDLLGIWTISLNDYSMERITEGDAMSWSPNGDQMVIIVNDSISHSSIKLVDIRNHNEQIIYQFDHDDSWNLQIAWAPTGEDLVIGVQGINKSGHFAERLYLLKADGSQFLPIFTDQYLRMWDPQWLPNGKWITFIAETAEGSIIAVAPITGECIYDWLPMIKDAEIAAVSPGGDKVIFQNLDGVFIIDLNNDTLNYLLPDQLKCH